MAAVDELMYDIQLVINSKWVNAMSLEKKEDELPGVLEKDDEEDELLQSPLQLQREVESLKKALHILTKKQLDLPETAEAED